MSNPVTNADIEDVLSSIRRLVSEEARPAAIPPAAVEPERLVLTPALRVMDTARPEEALPGAPVTAEADPAEEPEQDLPQPELLEGEELVGVELDETGRLNLEARIAELEAVISDTGGQWEQDGEVGGANAGGPVNPLDWEDAVTEIAAEAIAEEVLEQTAEMDDIPEAEFVHLEEHDAHEATVSPISDAFEVPADVVEEEPVEETVQDAPAPASPDADFAADDPDEMPEYTGTDFIVDEQMLRDLVSQIVRQELQGALGERITRNVRKLVRREIHRALASQELE